MRLIIPNELGSVIGAGLASWRFYPWLLAAPALILGII